MDDEEGGTAEKGLKFFQTLHQFPKPVIAKVGGEGERKKKVEKGGEGGGIWKKKG